jgi:hypothetical protein
MSELKRALFEEELLRRIDNYIPFIKAWYDNYYNHIFDGVGSFDMQPLTLEDGTVMEPPKGLMYRFSMSENHSAIKGLQAFPFVQLSVLDLPRAMGGVRNLTETILGRGWYDYGEVLMHLKQALVNTSNAQMFIAFITPKFFDKLPKGHYFWFTEQEICAVYNKIVPDTLKDKALKWMNVCGRMTTMRKVAEEQEAVKV